MSLTATTSTGAGTPLVGLRPPYRRTADGAELRDRYAPIKRLALVQIQPPPNPNKPLSRFSISDILSGNTGSRDGERGVITGGQSHSPRSNHHRAAFYLPHHHALPHPLLPSPPGSIHRPWTASPRPGTSESGGDSVVDSEEEIDVVDDPPPARGSGSQTDDASPLNALLQMTSKTFEGLDAQSLANRGEFQPFFFFL